MCCAFRVWGGALCTKIWHYFSACKLICLGMSRMYLDLKTASKIKIHYSIVLSWNPIISWQNRHYSSFSFMEKVQCIPVTVKLFKYIVNYQSTNVTGQIQVAKEQRLWEYRKKNSSYVISTNLPMCGYQENLTTEIRSRKQFRSCWSSKVHQ